MPEASRQEGRKATVRDVVLRDGRIIRVRVWPGIATPFVLLHGLLDSSEGWTEFARQTHRPCIAIDLPGFGASSRASRPELAAYAEDVLEVLDRLDVESAALVGHSLGGAIAAAVADRAPTRVAALGLLAPAGFGRIHLAHLVSLPGIRTAVQTALPLALRSRGALTAAYMTMVTAGRRPAGEVVERVVQRGRESVPGARDATEAIVRAANAFADGPSAYDGPVRVLWGRHDRLVPIAHLDGLRRALPHAQVETGSFGHHPHRECWDRLCRFMSEVYASAAATVMPASEPLREAAPPLAAPAAALAA